MGNVSGESPLREEGNLGREEVEKKEVQSPIRAKTSRVARFFLALKRKLFGKKRIPVAENHKVEMLASTPLSEVNGEIKEYRTELENVNLSELETLPIENFVRLLMLKAGDQSFVSGSFVVRDTGGLLKGYIDNLQEKGTERYSSHYNRERKGTEYGIDLGSPILGDKRHVLFFQLDKGKEGGPYYYFKPEEHGVSGIGAVLQHAWKYISIKLQRIWTGGASDEGVSYRKERIPPKPRAIFKRAIQHFSKKEQDGLLKKSKGYGISFMFKTVKELHNSAKGKADKLRAEISEENVSIEKEEAFEQAESEFIALGGVLNEFEEYVKAEGFEDLDIRTGKEVILDSNNLFSQDRV